MNMEEKNMEAKYTSKKTVLFFISTSSLCSEIKSQTLSYTRNRKLYIIRKIAFYLQVGLFYKKKLKLYHFKTK